MSKLDVILRSSSLYRSAAALSALLRLSTSCPWFGEFYVSIAVVEPIFHLESLANALDVSHPEKSYFLFLISLARARLHFILHDDTDISEELALTFRRSLLEILVSSRCVVYS